MSSNVAGIMSALFHTHILYLLKKRVQVILKQTLQEGSMNPVPALIKLSKKNKICYVCVRVCLPFKWR